MEVAIPFFAEDSTYSALSNHLKPIVYAMTIASITVHGVTIPISLLGSKAGPTLSKLTTRLTERKSDTDLVSELPRPRGPATGLD